MPTLFAKPVETLTADDVAGLIGWPESLTVEYKVTLSGQGGRADAWLSGGNVENYARDKLFKEVVAFANTTGGHLVLGVRETKETPPVAEAVVPVPRCVDLAERLTRMAQVIDPPIPLLLVQGIPTDGDAGVVVFRVPASHAAPHRAADKECYIRRGTNSVAMAMREIQDMTLVGGRRDERIDARFIKACNRFRTWMSEPVEEQGKSIGFRITAVPVGSQIELGRLYGRNIIPNLQQEIAITIDGRPRRVHALRLPSQFRAIVRGVRKVFRDEDTPTYLEAHSDGTVDLGFRMMERAGEQRLHLGWIASYLVNVLRTAHALRTAAGAPDCEYGVELEIACGAAVETVKLLINDQGWDSEVGEGLHYLPLTLPRISFGPISEIDMVLSAILTDLYDAAGAYQDKPLEVIVL